MSALRITSPDLRFLRDVLVALFVVAGFALATAHVSQAIAPLAAVHCQYEFGHDAPGQPDRWRYFCG